MAKITIAGNVFVITLSRTLDDLKKLEKYRPNALKIFKEDGDVDFAIGTGSASINQHGASFNAATFDDKKLACMTLKIPDGTEDAEAYVSDYVGQAYIKLKAIEAGLGDALNSIKEDMTVIKNDITNVSTDDAESLGGVRE